MLKVYDNRSVQVYPMRTQRQDWQDILSNKAGEKTIYIWYIIKLIFWNIIQKH